MFVMLSQDAVYLILSRLDRRTLLRCCLYVCRTWAAEALRIVYRARAKPITYRHLERVYVFEQEANWERNWALDASYWAAHLQLNAREDNGWDLRVWEHWLAKGPRLSLLTLRNASGEMPHKWPALWEFLLGQRFASVDLSLSPSAGELDLSRLRTGTLYLHCEAMDELAYALPPQLQRLAISIESGLRGDRDPEPALLRLADQVPAAFGSLAVLRSSLMADLLPAFACFACQISYYAAPPVSEGYVSLVRRLARRLGASSIHTLFLDCSWPPEIPALKIQLSTEFPNLTTLCLHTPFLGSELWKDISQLPHLHSLGLLYEAIAEPPSEPMSHIQRLSLAQTGYTDAEFLDGDTELGEGGEERQLVSQLLQSFPALDSLDLRINTPIERLLPAVQRMTRLRSLEYQCIGDAEPDDATVQKLSHLPYLSLE